MPETRRVDDLANQHRPAGKLPQFTVVLTATLAAFSIGNYVSCLLVENMNVNKEDTIWLTLVLPFGAMISAMPTGIIADKIGRKRTILIAAIPLLICWFPIVFTRNKIWVCLARILAGLACGTASVIVPLYVSEIAEDSLRNMLGIVFQAQFALGAFFTHALAFTCDAFVVTLLGILAPALLLILYPTLPESPAWLICQGRQVEADCALKRLRGEEYPTKEEITRLERNYRTDGTGVAFSESKGYKNAMITVAGLMLFQQPMIILATAYTGAFLWVDETRFTSGNLVWVLAGFLQTIAAVVCALLIDRAGKKILMSLSNAIMTIIMFTWCGYFYVMIFAPMVGQPSTPVAMYCTFVIAYGIGFGPIPWIMPGELFTGNMRSVACSVTALCHWLSAFSTYSALSAYDELLSVLAAFGVLGVIGLVGGLFIAVTVSGKKGKTIEQAQIELCESRGRDTRQPAIEMTRTRT